jgi:hypothetical protein
MAEHGWKSNFSGTLYKEIDPRCSGFGVPPNDPSYQSAEMNYGSGQLQLRQVMVDVTVDEDGNEVITEVT